MADFQVILEQSAFNGSNVEIKTKERGVISGNFSGVDEFDTDPNRLGFWIRTGKYEEDTVFLDEIITINVIDSTPIMANVV